MVAGAKACTGACSDVSSSVPQNQNFPGFKSTLLSDSDAFHQLAWLHVSRGAPLVFPARSNACWSLGIPGLGLPDAINSKPSSQ
jgi:hypothetical protein